MLKYEKSNVGHLLRPTILSGTAISSELTGPSPIIVAPGMPPIPIGPLPPGMPGDLRDPKGSALAAAAAAAAAAATAAAILLASGSFSISGLKLL